MTINGQTFNQELIERIQKLIFENTGISRRQISLKVCQWLEWRNANGDFKEMSCRVALLKLHRQGFIQLPGGRQKPPSQSPESLKDIEFPGILGIECSLSDLAPIKIIPIKRKDGKKSRIWNALMDRFHYLGSGPLCGAQMRYLIVSGKVGFIGGISFSSAAWRLEARDRWIGWDDEARKKHLDKVLCNSRFLVHPDIRVKNLASHALSLCIQRVSGDWRERYGIMPMLLETFVEQNRFKGTCYQASNWMYVGVTKGRGRQDTENLHGVPVKDVYLYGLRRDAQEKLRDGRARPVCEAKEPVDWADEEFGQAKLGDKRRVDRLLTIARDFYAKPEANIPQACGTRAKAKAAYRFFDDPEHKMDKILESHYQTTMSRMQREKVVLSVQDTTYLNYSAHPATENLGPIGTSADGAIGLVVHDTMAFNLDGTPLGLLDVQCWARDPEQFGKRHQRHELPIEQKESYKWLRSFESTQRAQGQCADTVLVSVGDRESDIYELFDLALKDSGCPKLLIRAERDRLLDDGQTHLWDHVKSRPLSGIREIHIPKRGKNPGRDAKLEIRFAKAILSAPKRKRDLNELTVWAILAEEMDAPAGVEPLKWMLITTLEINGFIEAVEKLDWYTLRYWIEVYHRTLKSGCKIEQRQLGQADRIEACLAIDMVIAWRIFHLTKLGRQTPDVLCTVFFEDAEWKALVAYKTQNPVPPEKPPSLREAMHMVASMGGFLGRKGDGEPGTKTMWLGLQRLDDLTEMWKTCIMYFAPTFMRAPPALVPS